LREVIKAIPETGEVALKALTYILTDKNACWKVKEVAIR
jgi:hypothetical protein